MRFVVLGGDAAGMSAATSVRAALPDAEVVAIERGPFTSYSMCGIPAFVGGSIETADELVARTPEEFERAGIAVHLRTEAIGIDPDRRTVLVRERDSGAEREEPYDKLLYAIGAEPVVPDLPGLDRWGHVVQTLDDGVHLRRHLDERDDVGAIVVVGGGYIGLEIAEALVDRGLRATLIDRSPQVMKGLDPEMAAHVQVVLERFGVDARLGESLVAVHEDEDGRCREVVTDRGAYPADLVVLALGARPRVALAAAAGCAVGPSGALVVDERLRTTVPGIWAAGDCVESRHLVSGQPVNIQLGTHANKQGKVAAIDIAGSGDAAFPGVVGTAVTKVCAWEIGRTGLTEGEASAAGLRFASVVFESTARSGYLPDAGVVHVKMLAEEGTGRLLGAQLVGTGNVAKRIDVAATWCQLGVSVADAQLFDLAYAPPFGGVWDLLQVGARKLSRALDLSPVL